MGVQTTVTCDGCDQVMPSRGLVQSDDNFEVGWLTVSQPALKIARLYVLCPDCWRKMRSAVPNPDELSIHGGTDIE